MTDAEWQAENTRLANEIARIEVVWKHSRDDGDWDSARRLQNGFHELRAAQKTHNARARDAAGNYADDLEVSFEDWQSAGDWISHELSALEIEWKEIRERGDWEAAREAQQKYQITRSRQSAHAKRMPKTDA